VSGPLSARSPSDRHLRDVLSAPIMVANERIRAADASLSLIVKGP
jgi:hypothetical protein